MLKTSTGSSSWSAGTVVHRGSRSRSLNPPRHRDWLPSAASSRSCWRLSIRSRTAIFESVSVVITAAGIKETQPRTDEEWLAVRNNALILAEAGNLLKMPRPVAPVKAIKGVAFEPPGPTT